MKRLSHFFNRLASMSNRMAVWGLVFTCALMSIIILLQIVFRFVIYVPIPWSEEAARYLMVWMGMLGSTVALRQGRHIGVTVLIDLLPPAIFRWALSATQVAMLVFLVVVAKEGLLLAVFNMTQLSPSLEIPMFFPYFAICFGAVLMILEIVAELLHSFFPTPAGISATPGK